MYCCYILGLVETDDKIAVKEIARQLAVEHIVSNRTFVSFLLIV